MVKGKRGKVKKVDPERVKREKIKGEKFRQ